MQGHGVAHGYRVSNKNKNCGFSMEIALLLLDAHGLYRFTWPIINTIYHRGI